MKNKINLVELLEDCPQGMELDCAMWNNVRFKCININSTYPIAITYPVGEELFTAELTEYGCWSPAESAKCVIFPKGKTTWEGFIPTWKFNTGDIIFTLCASGNIWISIFKKKGAFGEVETYADYYYNPSNNNLDYCVVNTYGASLCTEKDIAVQRLATEEEKEKLLKAIEDKGYKWNSENKTLEKSIEKPKPKFKVGDKIIKKNSVCVPILITKVSDDFYYSNTESSVGILSISEQDNYELVPDKFDINSLIPFESRVLVRDNDYGEWRGAFWGHLRQEADIKYDTLRGVYRQCIPYEGNEHLLGKTDDCIDFYKTWK